MTAIHKSSHAPSAAATPDSLPLSAAQRGIWFVQHVAGDLPISVAQYVDIAGEVDAELLAASCRRAGREFGSGYLRLIEKDGEPRQFVDEARGSLVTIADLRSEPEPEGTARALMVKDYSRPLDLLTDHLMTSAIYRIGTYRYLWYQRAHHIALDGYAAVTMLQRITDLYNAGCSGTEPPPSRADDYAKVIAQDAAYAGSERYQNDRAYWIEHLAGAPPVVSLAGRIGKPTLHPILVSTPLPSGTSALLDRTIADRGSGVTPVLVAAFGAYLARMTGSAEVLLSLPVSGRHSAVLRRSGGMVANVVPLRIRVAGRSVGEVIASTQSELTSALRRQRYRQEDIFRDMGIARDEASSFGPAVNLMMIDNHVILGETTARLHVLTSGPTSDLFVNIYPGAGDSSTHLDFQGNPNIYGEAELSDHHRRFLMFLDAFLGGGADRPLAGLPLLEPHERTALLTVGGATTAPARVLPDILADSVRRHRQSTAVWSGGYHLTYEQLDVRSSRVARSLRAAGCGPDTAVAIVLRRSVASIIAAWAVAKSGAAIVNIDPDYPRARIAHMIGDCGAVLAITASAHRDRIPDGVALLDADHWELDDRHPARDGAGRFESYPVRPPRAANVAYMTYTSGTTGRPKGVQVTHAGLAGLIADRSAAYDLTPDSRISYALSPGFDASMEQFLTCFANGSTLVIVPPDIIGGDRMTELLADARVTHLTVTTAMLATLDPEPLGDLRTVVVGGDVCPPHLVARWTRAASMINEYGPTEATITAAATAADPDRPSVVGGPIGGVRAMILDAALQPMPKGASGELYLCGPGLARGYANLPGATAAHYVADPHGGPGGRMYRTGDLARWVGESASWEIELLGRNDFQVKIRGYRIEPGEIDAVLIGHAGVAQSITVPVHNNADTVVLASYIVPRTGQPLEVGSIERFARQALPPHMVPAVFVPLDALPLNAFGKVDRGALPDPVFSSAQAPRRPATEREAALVELFSEVLGVREVGTDDSFFALGGDSILSIQLVARAKAGGLAFSTQDVFERKTVAALAAAASEVDETAPLAELPGGAVGPMPLSPIMHAMLDRGHVDRFAQSVLIDLPAGLERPDLVRVLGALIRRHDVLRAVLHDDPDSGGYLEVRPPAAVNADTILTSVPLRGNEAAEVDAALQEAADELDPRSGELIRAVWLRRPGSGQSDLMWLVIHHLAVDGVSWRILLADLAQAWQQIDSGVDPTVTATSTSVRRWLHGQSEQAQERTDRELDRWRAELSPRVPPLGPRVLDPLRDTVSTAGRLQLRIPADVTEAVLTTVPVRFHGSPNDALVAALGLALARWRRHRQTDSGCELIALEGHGREEQILPGADLTSTVGWFTTRFPVRLDLRHIDIDNAFAGGESAGAAIKAVKEQLRAMADNGIGYGMARHLDPGGRAALQRCPEPEVSLNYLGRADAGDPSGPWSPTAEFVSMTGTSDPLMALPAVIDVNAITEPGPDGPQLHATWDYATEILGSTDVEQLVQLWREALTGIADHVRDPAAGGFTPSDFPLVTATQPDIDHLSREYPSMHDMWPLSPLQAGLLFHATYDGGADGYTVQAELTLAGDVRPERLRAAAGALIDRHDSLRTAFVDVQSGPRQIVLRDVPVDWEQSDLGDRGDADARTRELRGLISSSAAPFDLAHPPLLRFHLIRLDEQEFRLVMTNHHIVLDGWSMPLLVHELLALYAGREGVGEIAAPRSYRGYLEWLQTRDGDVTAQAWEHALAGIESPTRIISATDRTGPVSSREVVDDLPDETTAAIGALTRTLDVTPNTALQVAWAVLLTVMTGRSDVVFGNTVSNRPPDIPGIERMVGLFINTVPLRLRLRPEESVADLLVRTQNEQTALLGHQHVGLAQLQRTTGLGDMFDTVTVLESYPFDRSALEGSLAAAGLEVVDLVARDATPYPLSLQVIPPRPAGAGRRATSGSGTYRVMLKYAADHFDSADARRLLDRYTLLLRQMLVDPDRRVAALASTWDTERAQLISGTASAGAPVRELREILYTAAQRHPEAVAVRAGERAVTYAELAARADHVAAELIGRGVRPETLVALAVPRSLELVVGVWAIARTGAAFVALDPANPPERIAELVEDCGARVGVTVDSMIGRLPGDVDWLTLDPDTYPGRVGEVGDERYLGPGADARSVVIRPDNAAYVIYTSGSTGRPKAVIISHRGLANVVSAQALSYGVDSGSTVLQVASPGFDACIAEILLAHGSGATLAVAPHNVYGGEDLGRFIRASDVSHAIITPSVLSTLDPGSLPSLWSVAMVGEASEPALVDRWAPGHRLMNHYGPTECTIWSTGNDDLHAGISATIGRPVAGVSAMVLDQWLRPAPVGVAGELYIGGPGLARGYLRRAGVSASRFVAAPFARAGTRMYRTGDSARWVAGSRGLELDYLGRTDEQVKIRGLRIEPGDIDARLGAHPSVARVATVVQQGPTGSSVLVSFVVAAPGESIDTAALHAHIAETMAHYLNPTAIIEIDAMPVTRTGKIDRKALGERPFEAESVAGRSPSTAAEHTMARLFAEVLNTTEVFADSNFFTLGGDSIVSMRLVAMANAAGLPITPRDVFEAKTVAALAACASPDSTAAAPTQPDGSEAGSEAGAMSGEPSSAEFALVDLTAHDIDLLRRRFPAIVDVWPLSPTQSGIHFRSTFDTDAPDGYTVQSIVAFSGDLDVERLQRAAQAVIDRHDILRTGFVETSAGICQVVLGTCEVRFEVLDLAPGDRDDPDEMAAADASRGFDLSEPSLIRFTVLRLGGGSYRLLITNHHVVLDGWSMPLLMHELLGFYSAPDTLDDLDRACSYRDYLVWLREQDGDAARAAWAAAYTDVDTPTRATRADTADALSAVGEVRADFSGARFARLREVVAASAVTVNTALSAAWSMVLRVLTGDSDVTFGSAVSGRPAQLPGADRALGMFLNTVPVRAHLGPGQSLRQLMVRMQDQYAQLLDHHHLGLPEIQRSIGVPELFDTAMAYQSFPLHRAQLQELVSSAGLTIDQVSGLDATPYPLSVVIAPRGQDDSQGLEITLRHTREVDALRARQIVDDFVDTLGLMADDPDRRLAAVEVTEVAPQRPPGRQPDPATLYEILTRSAARAPDAVAVTCAGHSLTYRELDKRSNRLARLLRQRGVGPTTVIACVLPRSLEAVVAMWAAAKLGVPFLPVDPSLPADRIAYVVRDSGAEFGLTASGIPAGPAASLEWLVIDEPATASDLAQSSAQPVGPSEHGGSIPLDATAYVIYTSGSTGRPKGVAVSHRGLARVVAAQHRLLDADENSTVLQVASASFDASVFELLWAHGSGGRLVISDQDVFSGAELADLIRREHVSHAVLTPSVLATVPGEGLNDLRVLATAGESVGPELVDRWAPGREMVNLYGPTESTIWATASAALHPGDSINIGSPVGPVSAVVLDTWLRPVPRGVDGELYLSGPGLARGYVGKAAMTSARFVPCPSGEPGARMYRTGDVVRRRVDGALEYLGRNDFQVKIRGVRVELGEIDSALGSLANVEHAVTVPHGPDGRARTLVSYVVAAPQTTVVGEDLRAQLGGLLPTYMVPSAVVVIDEIPMTPSGKSDWSALPEPVTEAREFRAPSTRRECAVAVAFEEALGISGIGADDDFFALGGDSLSASLVAGRLGASLGVRVPVRAVFEAPTAARLAGIAATLDTTGRRPLGPVARPETIPLSLAQQRLWFLNRLDPDSAAYNVPVVLRLTGRLDVAALREALGDVVDRHEILRTTYPEAAGVPRQRIAAHVPTTMQTRACAEADLPDAVTEFVRQGFDVTADVPLRVGVFDGGNNECLFVLVLHHIAGDGQSMGPLARDLMLAYAARVAGHAPTWAPPAVQYADYALWQREMLGAADDSASLMHAQLAFWRSTLADCPERIELPADHPRPVVASLAGGRVPVQIGADLHRRCSNLARAHGVSLFMVMHAAFVAVLGRLSGIDDVVIGTPVAGRGEPGLDALVGMFVNTLPLRARVHRDETFADLLGRVRDADLRAFDNADVPFERVVEELNPRRSSAHHPLFQVALAFQKTAGIEVGLPGLTVSRADADTGVCLFDLQLIFSDSAESAGAAEGSGTAEGSGAPAGFAGVMMYARDLFSESTVAGFVRRFLTVLTVVADDPAVALGDIDWLSDDERADLLSRVGPHADADPVLLGDVLAAAVRANPTGAAVVAGDVELTYEELDRRSNRLARMLIARGAAPERAVAVAVERSVESIVAWWAVVRSGAPYVPIDPSYPAARIRQMVADSGAQLGIATSSVVRSLPQQTEWLVPDDDAVAARIAALDPAAIEQADRVRPVHAGNTAWVVFTSGSTGRPKGVSVTHAGLRHYLDGLRTDPPTDSSARVLHFASPSFDAALLENLLAVGAGSALVVAPVGMRGGAELADLLRARRVSHAFVTPAALASVEPSGLDDLRVVMSGGDEVPTDLVGRWVGAGPARSRQFRVLYGPTEATIVATATAPLAPGEPSTIGTPLPAMAALVLDGRLQPVPAGVAGELYLAGPGLARGYLNRPELSAATFIANPFAAPGTRMYRTGDVVRWNSGGSLEFLGRDDFQVKVNGFRVELGEIDAALGTRDEVAFAVTVPLRDEAAGTRLVSYVVPSPGAIARGDELHAALTTVLPSYMVPAAVMVIAAVPLTASGKLDRKALPAPVFEVRRFRAPATPTEGIVAGIFAKILGVERVGADDDFFELGGNSLSATRVVARIGAALDTEVPVSLVFDGPTVGGLAALIDSSTRSAPVALRALPRPQHLPLSHAQQRMWYLNRFEPDSPAYSIPIVVRLTGRLDVEALRGAIEDVIERHEILRTVYPLIAGEPTQVVAASDAVHLLDSITPSTKSSWSQDVSELLRRPFDVTTDLPVRIALFDIDGSEWVLALAAHHICADGASMTPLTRDLVTAYTARTAHLEPAWEPLSVQYADYALWQRSVLGTEDDPHSILRTQITYWGAQLEQLPTLLELPADRPRPAVQSHSGGSVPFAVDADLHAGLQRIARAHNSTLFMVIHAALAVTLGRLAATDDVTIGTPYVGRAHAELDDVIGMFVNTLALRTRLAPGMSLHQLIDHARETDLAALAHADVPFERVVEEVNPIRSHGHHPLFQVMLVFQDPAATTVELPDLTMSAVQPEAGVALFDLQVTVSDTYDPDGSAAGIDGEMTYATELFDAATVSGMLARLHRVLSAMVADPAQPLHDVDLLDDAERHDALVRFNTTDHAAPPAETLATVFAAAADRHHDCTAIVGGDEALSYRDFGSRVNRLARWLITRGVGPETLVGLQMRRCVDQVVAMYAVHAAGGGYIPVDPDHPADRIDHVLRSAEPVLVLSSLERIDLSGFDDAPLTDDDRLSPLRPDHVAYVLFTSGSTGKPKGVSVSHRAVVNQIHWISDRYALTSEDVVLQKTPATFDVSVWELFATLAVGARLVVAAPDGHLDPAYLARMIAAHRITLTSFVPSMLAVFLDVVPAELLGSLRALLVAGEALGRDVALAAASALPAVEIHNLYGPTEFTVHATAQAVDGSADGPVPMGTPVWNARAYVLDSRLRPVPLGVTGELYLSGSQVARGYHGRPGLTAERFVPDPHRRGQRMYRTGDLVRRLQTGALEYLGRSDSQIKLRGLRIELGEIEVVFGRHPALSRAIATVGRADDAEYLAVYLVPASADIPVDTADVLAAAAHELPRYMLPTSVVVLDTLPLTASGKLDRGRLPEPVLAADEFREPESGLEARIAHTFEQVLGVPRVGADDDFYALGGNSLRSVQVITALNRNLDVEVPLRWMRSDPSPAELAHRITGGGPDNETDTTAWGLDVLLPIRTEGERPPLFCVHPASGLAWCYQPLHQYVGPGRPIYGIQAPQISGETPESTTIGALARRYFDEVRTVQPTGPYHLLGWSLGGVIAHAVAAQMRASGEQVELLAMLDAEADAVDGSAVSTITAGELVSNLGPVMGVDYVAEDATAEEAARQIAAHVGEDSGIDAGLITRLTDAYNISIRAAGDWQPPVVDCDLLYFSAAQEREADAAGHRGWEPFVNGEIANVDVDATHLSMTDNDAIAHIAAVLDDRLD